MPALRAETLTETVRVPVPVPEEGETLSQFPPEEVLATAVQFSVPPPGLEIVTV